MELAVTHDRPVAGSRQVRAKRVLLANPWSTCHGGTSMVLLEFVQHLDRTRYEPLVLCPTEGELPRRLTELDAPYLVHSIAGLTRQSWRPFVCDAYWCVRLLRRNKIDLVHLNGPKWRSSLAWAAHYCRVPLVVHVHNPVRHAEKNFTLAWAKRILPVSRAVGEELWASRALRPATHVVHNGVELARFSTTGDNNRAELGVDESTPLLGFVGQIVP
ncbi:MAG: glycosyltransferase, partial [Planctomycetales bacterium]|nr:glycosyltransferase [Planctomycetales bacterium]